MIFGYIPPVILHSLGIAILFKMKGKLPNQRILIMNLASAELMNCMWKVIGRCILTKLRHNLAIFYAFFNIAFHLSIRFIMLLIIIDRFLYIWLNIKYQIYINRKRLRNAIIMQWVLCVPLPLVIVLILTFDYKKSAKTLSKMIVTMYVALDISIIMASICTLGYFFSKVKKITKNMKKRRRKQSNVVTAWFKLKIPCLMVTTFIIFNTSNTLVRYNVHHNEGTLSIVFVVLDICGWCSDACIYIFLQKRATCILRSMFMEIKATFSRGKKKQVSRFEMNELQQWKRAGPPSKRSRKLGNAALSFQPSGVQTTSFVISNTTDSLRRLHVGFETN